MLQTRNKTAFATLLTVLPDRSGADGILTIVKATFDLRKDGKPAEKQAPVVAADVHHGDPAKTSIKVPCDISLPKPAVDVLLLGHAYGGTSGKVDVTLRVGTGAKTVRVVGDRTWSDGLLGAKASPPAPFEKIPLIWERAFGGVDAHPKTPDKKKGEDRNPVGRGFHHFVAPVEGTPLPNLEPTNGHYRAWRDRPDPACFAPVGPGWLPRRQFAGTYDEAWQKTRAPYLPEDFDERFLQIAPPDQILPAFSGGEILEAENVTPSGKIRFTMPRIQVTTTAQFSNGSPVTLPAKLDTVILEPDEQRVILVWRSFTPADKKWLQVREVEILAAGN